MPDFIFKMTGGWHPLQWEISQHNEKIIENAQEN